MLHCPPQIPHQLPWDMKLVPGELCHGHQLAKCCRGFLQSHSKVINPLKQAGSAFFHTLLNSRFKNGSSCDKTPWNKSREWRRRQHMECEVGLLVSPFRNEGILVYVTSFSFTPGEELSNIWISQPIVSGQAKSGYRYSRVLTEFSQNGSSYLRIPYVRYSCGKSDPE
jgi:hypothetical protein